MTLFIKRKLKSLTAKAKIFRQNRLNNQTKKDAIDKEIKLYKTLATIYDSLIGKHKYPFAEVMRNETLRAAASLEDIDSTYQLAEILLEEAKFRENLEKEEVFGSTMNARYVKILYEEAHAYLLAAQKLGSIEAKRLLGICYIHGHGVKLDRDQGFDLVVASIEQENSWDRVPEIFASIAKDDPELFSALMKHRGKS